jgi:DNA-binding winged helix-turn-helix (wHTH) protein
MNLGQEQRESSHIRAGWHARPGSRRFAAFGPFQLDLERRELFRNGNRLRLQAKVADVLFILLESPGQVVTREALRIRLWPHETHVNYDANVNTTINKLRRILGESPDNTQFIETVPRQGYAFVGKLEYFDNPPAKLSDPTLPHIEPVREKTKSSILQKWHLGAVPPTTWFIAGVIALLVSGMLLGATVMLFRHH